MAHLITLTGAVDGQEMLFNLVGKRRQPTKRLTLRPKWNKVVR
jgi:hypothetical protein